MVFIIILPIVHNIYMSESVQGHLRYCGQDVKIRPLARIVRPHMIEIGDNSLIDNFTFINGGTGVRIGKCVYVSCFASIVGGGELIIGDYATIGYGSKIITAIDAGHGDKPTPRIFSEKQGDAIKNRIIIENGVLIGTDVVIHPNVRIGEGAVIGDHSRVLEDVEPWSINMGSL
jgi:acetyltransferase-like isoleucine patch superfamily enzyme